MRHNSLLILTVFMLCVPFTFAEAVPQTISFQGRLSDAGGNPVADGTYDVTLTIYDAAAAGNVKWTEDQKISTVGGLFTTLLGSETPIPDSVFSSDTRYLAIEVSGDPEMTPRTPLVSVPYAYRAGSGGGWVQSGDIVSLSDPDDSVGVGTSTPTSKFEVAGHTRITGKLAVGPGAVNTGFFAFVAGTDNSATGNYSNIPGGAQNSATGNTSVISGGSDNLAGGHNSVIGGGTMNATPGINATVAGGGLDTAAGYYSFVGGGFNNIAGDSAATVVGGWANRAEGFRAFAGGGLANRAVHRYSSVVGGYANAATGIAASVVGGQSDSANGYWSFVGGGYLNRANDTGATVAGGLTNQADGVFSAIAGGGGSNPGDRNSAGGYASAISGGQRNSATGVHAAVSGGYGNIAGDSSAVGGGVLNQASGAGSAIGGGVNNKANGRLSTVAGGAENSAGNQHSTVGGGFNNGASGLNSVVAGGASNTAGGSTAAVGGGFANDAGGGHAVVGGGNGDTASGLASVVPGGEYNRAAGDYSFAAGRRAKAEHNGSFVWADQTDADFTSTGSDQFLVRASGGVGFGTDNPYAFMTVNGTVGFAQNPWPMLQLFESGTQNPTCLLIRPTGSQSSMGLYFRDSTDRFEFRINLIQAPALCVDVASGRVGVMTSLPAYTLDVQGTIGGSSGLYHASDRRFKKDIRELEGALDRVTSLRGVSYRWRVDEYPERGFEDALEIGLIAQEVEEIVPEVVHTGEDGYKGVDYARLVPLLIEGIKAQQHTIEAQSQSVATLQAEVAELKARMANLSERPKPEEIAPRYGLK